MTDMDPAVTRALIEAHKLAQAYEEARRTLPPSDGGAVEAVFSELVSGHPSEEVREACGLAAAWIALRVEPLDHTDN